MKKKTYLLIFISVIILFGDLFASLYFIKGISIPKFLGLEKQETEVKKYNFTQKQWWNDPLILDKIREPETILINGLVQSVAERLIVVKTENGDTVGIVPVKKIRMYKFSTNSDDNNINHDNSKILNPALNVVKKDIPVVVNAVMENNILLGVSIWIK